MDLLERLQERLDAIPAQLAVRSMIVEDPCGTFKSWMGATHFEMRTLKKVATRDGAACAGRQHLQPRFHIVSGLCRHSVRICQAFHRSNKSMRYLNLNQCAAAPARLSCLSQPNCFVIYSSSKQKDQMAYFPQHFAVALPESD